MTDAKGPLLVVTGTWPAWTVEASLAGFAFTFIGALASGVVAFSDRGVRDTTAVAFTAGGLAVVAGVLKWIHAKARRRSWRVEFADDQIRFFNRDARAPRVTVPWRDIAWFSDHEAECVQLKLVGPVSSFIDLQIPTPTDPERFAVLELLTGRGVKRSDA